MLPVVRIHLGDAKPPHDRGVNPIVKIDVVDLHVARSHDEVVLIEVSHLQIVVRARATLSFSGGSMSSVKSMVMLLLVGC